MPDNDPSILDDCELYRLVHPELDVSWDPDRRVWVLSSRAFQNSSGTESMSVVLGDTLSEEGRSPEDANRSKSGWFIVALTAAEVRGEDQGVTREPTTIEAAHGSVNGEKKKPRQRRLRDLARWVVAPPPEGG